MESMQHLAVIVFGCALLLLFLYWTFVYLWRRSRKRY
jgi:hypothetical protein